MKTKEKLLIVLAILGTVAGGQSAHAKTITVNSNADSGPGSLRAALTTAAPGDTININAKLTILLTSGELVVSKNLTIRGPGANGPTINGNGTSRVFHILPGTTVTIDGVTITNGRASLDVGAFTASAGGGIYSDHARLTVSNCTVSGNTARFGAGIFSSAKDGGSASLTVNNSTISNNAAHSTRGFDGADGGGIFSGGGFFNTGPSGIATLTLTNTAVTGNSAEQAGGGVFNDGFAGSATLTITNSTLSGNSAADNFNDDALGGAIFNNGDSGIATLTIKGSTLSDNSANNLGGAVFNDGDGSSSVTPGTANMTVNNCTFSNNSAVIGGGGGIYSFCGFGNTDVTLTNTDLTANVSGFSGGICFQNFLGDGTARLTMTSCVVRNNSASFEGGGIEIQDAMAIITNTTVSGNLAVLSGGGISIDDGLPSAFLSQVTFANCTISNNSTEDAGGGIFNKGTELDLIRCTIGGNSAQFGGGIFSEPGGGVDNINRNVTLENSTVSSNSAVPQNNGGAGGGIFNGAAGPSNATIELINSTVSGNSAVEGGGIYNEADGSSEDSPGIGIVTVKNSTLSGNSATFGGGIFTVLPTGRFGIAPVDLANSIINAGSSGENIVAMEDGTITSSGYNLSSDAAGGDATIGPGGLLNGPGDIRNTDPLLGPLKNNGGPTMTHALLSHSPAIDAGDPNFNPYLFNPPLLYDQRGPGFPRIVNARLDIGAFESKFRHP